MNEKERQAIDAIDSQMARLFEERMAAVERIAQNKKAAGAPIEDAGRENAMLARRCAELGNPSLEPYYSDFLRSVIRVSKDYQGDIISGQATPASNIFLGRGSLGRSGEICGICCKQALIVTDSGVPAEYPKAVEASLAGRVGHCTICTIPQGEANKNIEIYKNVLESLVRGGFTRTDCVIAVGGGVVGDLAGFAAASYMRGIDFYNIPTTLLSQVDSSVGGKTAIDFGEVKNIVGAFHMPQKVIVDPDTLSTLPLRQLHNGLAEAIKMGATGDATLFGLIENSTDLLSDIEEIIRRCLNYKMSIVNADPTEKGLRRVLNFGHTVGHAIEACSAGEILHGEAVGLGMLYFCEGDARRRISAVLAKYGLPVSHNIPANLLMDKIARDKKAAGDSITIVRVASIGSFSFEKINIRDLKL